MLAACSSPDADGSLSPDPTAVATTSPIVAADSLVDTSMEGVRITIAIPSIAGADAANGAMRDIVQAFVDDVRPESGPPPETSYGSYEIDGDFDTEYVGDGPYSGVVTSYVSPPLRRHARPVEAERADQPRLETLSQIGDSRPSIERSAAPTTLHAPVAR